MIVLDSFTLGRFRFELVLRDHLYLPVYKGSTLRGGFGHAFKRMVCAQRTRSACAACLLQGTCPYAYVFETSPPQDAEVLRTHSDVPLPFVMEPPLEQRREYGPGETLGFGLVLVGKAVDLLPYFVVAFQELGRTGLGRQRGRFVVRSVEAINALDGSEASVYSEQAPGTIVKRPEQQATFEDMERVVRDWSSDRLTLRFLTPTRLKHNGRYMDQPDFHVVFRALLRRVSSLSYFHCGERWETDYRGWIEKAREVQTVAARAGWVDWERYSTRQRRRMNLGGVIGEMTYGGELGPFMPLLALGQYVHVGKACAFGNGQYVMVGRED